MDVGRAISSGSMGMIFWPRSGITPYIAPHRLQLNREFGGTNAPLDIRRVRKRFQAKPQNSPITVYTFQVWTLLCKLGEEKNVKACYSNLPQLEIDMNHVLFQTALLPAVPFSGEIHHFRELLN